MTFLLIWRRTEVKNSVKFFFMFVELHRSPWSLFSRLLWSLKWLLASLRTCCSFQTSPSCLFAKGFVISLGDLISVTSTFILLYVDKQRCLSFQDAVGQLAASTNTFPSLLRELLHIIFIFWSSPDFPFASLFVSHFPTRWSYSCHRRHFSSP